LGKLSNLPIILNISITKFLQVAKPFAQQNENLVDYLNVLGLSIMSSRMMLFFPPTHGKLQHLDGEATKLQLFHPIM